VPAFRNLGSSGPVCRLGSPRSSLRAVEAPPVRHTPAESPRAAFGDLASGELGEEVAVELAAEREYARALEAHTRHCRKETESCHEFSPTPGTPSNPLTKGTRRSPARILNGRMGILASQGATQMMSLNCLSNSDEGLGATTETSGDNFGPVPCVAEAGNSLRAARVGGALPSLRDPGRRPIE